MKLKLYLLAATVNALPFWGSGKFQPRQMTAQCNILYDLVTQDIPIEFRQNAFKEIIKKCYTPTRSTNTNQRRRVRF